MLSKLATLALAGTAAALPAIHITGQKFFYENGTQFFIKGIAYQQDTAAISDSTGDSKGYIDPLADADNCKRDVPLLQELGINTIRTYAIDPTADHTECMKLLEDAGIYIISDLSQPELSILRDDPKWTVEHFDRYKAVVDELAQYDNIIGFFAGNEVSDANNNTEASAFVKAALRDTKQYIDDKDYNLGVGYATNDHPDIRDDIATYFNCGDDDEATDFWGYNIYSWCGESTMEKSGYSDWVDFYKDYNVPVFFAEYGCNNPGGAANRKFQETGALFSDEMTGVFSGGLVYMYFQEDNDYGVVEVKNDKVTKMKDFDALKKAHAAADPKGVTEDEYDGAHKRETCPAISKYWKANSVLPPTPDSELCECAVAASECGVAKGTDEEEFGDVFAYICGNTDLCHAINANGTTGVYGAYSMCNPSQQLSILLGMYYDSQNGASDACDFDGVATTKTANAASTCDKALASATAHNEKVATATSAVDASTDDDTDDDVDTDDTDADDADSAATMAGAFSVAAYMALAISAGAAMIAL
ncbi:X8 domain [Geosmithia morbida]|uniref:1,3-beta-glucanosyltransferase n=1 Tax=Geosmithia morbida TaxID=1094350 RepID=A0A9P4YU58_9HYPO|nr:X8 domain [Geosmithia morbida]KAF4121867.1 X8 domain [Geosmithia morbida]